MPAASERDHDFINHPVLTNNDRVHRRTQSLGGRLCIGGGENDRRWGGFLHGGSIVVHLAGTRGN